MPPESSEGEASSARGVTGVVPWATLVQLRQTWKGQRKTVVWTNGCFDVLHVGHLHCLEQAKRLGDILVVGVNTDIAVKTLKGVGRPIFPLEERMRMLAALEVTDYVVAFEGTTPEATLLDLRPDVHVKGADYAPPAGKSMPEMAVVASYGGRIEFVALLPEHSSSNVIERMRQGQSSER